MDAIRFLISVLACEQWLRFSWLDEDECIRIGQDARAKAAARFPELVPLMDRMEGKTVTDGEASRLAILDVAEQHLGHDTLVRTLDDEAFQAEVRRFQGWVQDEAETPTCDAADFGAWFDTFIAGGNK
jgi:hypothetical protein